jgi:hypothetical protein
MRAINCGEVIWWSEASFRESMSAARMICRMALRIRRSQREASYLLPNQSRVRRHDAVAGLIGWSGRHSEHRTCSEAAMTGSGKDTPPTTSLGAYGCLVRLGWMFLGSVIVMFSAVGIVRHEGFLSLADGVFRAALAACIVLRYVDIKYLRGHTVAVLTEYRAPEVGNGNPLACGATAALFAAVVVRTVARLQTAQPWHRAIPPLSYGGRY